jgi:hypothetical protein
MFICLFIYLFTVDLFDGCPCPYQSSLGSGPEDHRPASDGLVHQEDVIATHRQDRELLHIKVRPPKVTPHIAERVVSITMDDGSISNPKLAQILQSTLCRIDTNHQAMISIQVGQTQTVCLSDC